MSVILGILGILAILGLFSITIFASLNRNNTVKLENKQERKLKNKKEEISFPYISLDDKLEYIKADLNVSIKTSNSDDDNNKQADLYKAILIYMNK